jgi:hypothetical protein
MQNLGNVYIWGSPFVLSRTDAQNGVEIIFKNTLNFSSWPNSRQYCNSMENFDTKKLRKLTINVEQNF